MLHLFPYFVFVFAVTLNCASHVTTAPTPQSDVGFPEREHVDIDRINTRVPLYIPGRCQLNQLLYPGDQKNDWICDCKPGYLYYAPLDGCYAAYRQGPCGQGEYLTLATGDFTPKCTENPCRTDGFAFYNKKCYELNKPDQSPCDLEQGAGIFGVHTSNFTLGCIKGNDRLSAMVRPIGGKTSAGTRVDTNTNN